MTKKDYTNMDELENLFRCWYMDLMENKEHIHGLL